MYMGRDVLIAKLNETANFTYIFAKNKRWQMKVYFDVYDSMIINCSFTSFIKLISLLTISICETIIDYKIKIIILSEI